MSKIFEEAIADVKKLREVAEKNAKNAIIESVTPRIREYVESKIFENEANHQVNESLSDGEIKKLAKFAYEKNMNKNLVNKAIENLNKDNRNKFNKIINKINENKETFNSDKINNKEIIQKGNNMSEKFYEIDLNLLREAVEEEAESHKLAEMYAEEDEAVNEQDEDLPLEDVEPDEAAAGGEISQSDVEAAVADLIADLNLDLGGGAPEGEELPEDLLDLEGEEDSEEEDSEEEDSDDPLSEMYEEDELNEVFDIDPDMLRQEIQKVKSMLSEGNMDHHFGGKGEGRAGVKNAFGGSGPKKTGYQKSFGGGDYGKDVFVTPPATLKKLNEAKKMLQKLSRMNRAQNEKLNKYRGAVHTLREQLEDLNLFNAKLLYVNKLLQNKSLNESQKRSVIKALDEAKSLGETKALFKSLTESLGTSNSSKTLSESTRFGSSSRSTRSSAPAGNEKSAADVTRWQKLAGLK
jgi:hypothetical protein